MIKYWHALELLDYRNWIYASSKYFISANLLDDDDDDNDGLLDHEDMDDDGDGVLDGEDEDHPDYNDEL